MPKPILLLYSADSCPACERFIATQWDKLKTDAGKYVSDIKHYSQKSMKPSDWNKSVPSALKTKVSYFPSLFLVRAADWGLGDDAQVTAVLFPAKDKSEPLEWIKETSVLPSLTSTSPTGNNTPKSTAQPTTNRRKNQRPTIAAQGVQGETCSLAYNIRGKK